MFCARFRLGARRPDNRLVCTHACVPGCACVCRPGGWTVGSAHHVAYSIKPQSLLNADGGTCNSSFFFSFPYKLFEECFFTWQHARNVLFIRLIERFNQYESAVKTVQNSTTWSTASKWCYGVLPAKDGHKDSLPSFVLCAAGCKETWHFDSVTDWPALRAAETASW